MRTVMLSLIVMAALGMPASAQQLHLDTPLGDVHVGQGRVREHHQERPAYQRNERSYGHDSNSYGHDRPRHIRNCHRTEYHDHHGNHRVRTVCD